MFSNQNWTTEQKLKRGQIFQEGFNGFALLLLLLIEYLIVIFMGKNVINIYFLIIPVMIVGYYVSLRLMIVRSYFQEKNLTRKNIILFIATTVLWIVITFFNFISPYSDRLFSVIGIFLSLLYITQLIFMAIEMKKMKGSIK